jgi:hypothetical protein
MASKPHPLTAAEGAFVLSDGTPSHSPQQMVAVGQKLQSHFEQVVASIDPKTLPEPDLCTYGKERTKNDLFRFRWFNAIQIGGKNYGLGANLHSSGTLGGMWLIGLHVVNTPELHPKKPPQIPNQPAWLALLKTLVANGTFKKKLKT